MKKHLTILVALFVALAVAMPALAAVEFKYGGQFRARLESSDNIQDGTDGQTILGGFPDGNSWDDNRNFIDQRLRLYFSFIASQNLKVVTKFEMGDTVWGDGKGGSFGRGSGGNVGADGVSVELKNAYVEFNIPMTPSTAIVGIQSLALLDSWIIDDDFSAAVVVTKLDPFKVTVGYVAGQNGAVSIAGDVPYSDQSLNIDDFFLSIDYKQGPFKASLIGFYQYGHDTPVSFDPNTLFTPVGGYVGHSTSTFLGGGGTGRFLAQDNNLFDLGFNLSYKIDWLSAYVNFVKNFGGLDLIDNDPTSPTFGLKGSSDYTGWMIDAGVSYYCGPWTFNVGGFYTTGPELTDNPITAGAPWWDYSSPEVMKSMDVTWFTYPLATAKYFSEIIGGGVLGDDKYAYRGYPFGVGQSQNQMDNIYWRGYGFPTNLWTVTVGAAWQVAEKTKISASYWYFGTAEQVPVAYNPLAGEFEMSSSIGHELNLYIDQGIVDGLNLTLVGAYLFANEAFAPVPTQASTLYWDNNAADAYEIGARLQWNF